MSPPATDTAFQRESTRTESLFAKVQRSELSADGVEFVRELLASRGDRDLASGLLDQASCNVLFSFQGHERGRIVKPHERVKEPLHLLEERGGELDAPSTELFQGEATQRPDDVPEAEQVRRIRHTDVPRARELFSFQDRVDEERLAGLLHRVLDGPGVVQIEVVLQEAAELQDLLAGLLQCPADVLPSVHPLDRRAAQAGDRPGGLDRELSDLVLLVETGFDLLDNVVEVLHVCGWPIPLFEGWPSDSGNGFRLRGLPRTNRPTDDVVNMLTARNTFAHLRCKYYYMAI